MRGSQTRGRRSPQRCSRAWSRTSPEWSLRIPIHGQAYTGAIDVRWVAQQLANARIAPDLLVAAQDTHLASVDVRAIGQQHAQPVGALRADGGFERRDVNGIVGRQQAGT